MDTPKERRIGQDAGPLVRPYALTGGRTRPQGVRLDLITVLVASVGAFDRAARMSRDQARLLDLCRTPHTVADLTSLTGRPLGVVQVLLGDLYHQGLIEEHRETSLSNRPDPATLKRLLDELQSL